MTMITGLQCRACGAALPTPTSPTVKCEYCDATYVVSRPAAAGAAATIGTSDAPGALWVPMRVNPRGAHEFLIDVIASTPHVSLEFVRALGGAKMTSSGVPTWVFTEQIKGGFTCLSGIREVRQVQRKIGNNIITENVEEMRWTPFSGQIRTSRVLVGNAGDVRSDAVARTLRGAKSLTKIIDRGTPWEPPSAPQVTAREAWKKEVAGLADAERDAATHQLIQGDVYKNVQYSVETSWQPTALVVEVGHFAVDRYVFDVVALSKMPEMLGGGPPPVDQALVARHNELRDVMARAGQKVSTFTMAAAAVAAGFVLLAWFVSNSSGGGGFAVAVLCLGIGGLGIGGRQPYIAARDAKQRAIDEARRNDVAVDEARVAAVLEAKQRAASLY